MVAEVLGAKASLVSSAEVIPGKDGVFLVSAGGNIIFSKEQEQRFPHPGEVVKRLEALGS